MEASSSITSQGPLEWVGGLLQRVLQNSGARDEGVGTSIVHEGCKVVHDLTGQDVEVTEHGIQFPRDTELDGGVVDAGAD